MKNAAKGPTVFVGGYGEPDPKDKAPRFFLLLQVDGRGEPLIFKFAARDLVGLNLDRHLGPTLAERGLATDRGDDDEESDGEDYAFDYPAIEQALPLGLIDEDLVAGLGRTREDAAAAFALAMVRDLGDFVRVDEWSEKKKAKRRRG